MSTALFLCCLAALPAVAPGESDADTIVVCPPAYRQALEPWLVYRGNQGHRLVVIDTTSTSDTLADRIRDATGSKTRFLLLVGDTSADVGAAGPQTSTAVPTCRPRARINVRWGSEPEIASDSPLADLDSDGVPDLAVGRLSVTNTGELSRLVQRILNYEQATERSALARQFNVVAGAGGLGPMIDLAIEAAAKTVLCEYIPSAYHTSLTYSSWRSPYCPGPAFFRQATLNRLYEGSLFWVYVGHGQRDGLDAVLTPVGPYPILLADDIQPRSEQPTPTIAVFLACYTAAYDGPQPCLAEQLLRTEGGPVAVVGGSRVTMPYGMLSLATEMLDAYFQHHSPTLGELLLTAKRQLLLQTRDDPRRQVFDVVARAVHPGAADLAAERAEHGLLFNLLGDPLLRLPHSQTARLKCDERLAANSKALVTGVTEITAGEAIVELTVRRGQQTIRPPVRAEFDATRNAQREYTFVYERANDGRLASAVTTVVDGRFQVEINVPPDVYGTGHVRAFIRQGSRYAVTAVDVELVANRDKNESSPAP